MADQTFDAVIVGGGNKALLLALYLIEYGGMSVGIFERRNEIGGCLATEEISAPGFRGNTHANIILPWYYTPVWRDFPDFWTYGAQWDQHTCSDGFVFRDNETCLAIYSQKHDPSQERTANEIARFSKKDAETWLKLWSLAESDEYMRVLIDSLVESRRRSFDHGRRPDRIVDFAVRPPGRCASDDRQRGRSGARGSSRSVGSNRRVESHAREPRRGAVRSHGRSRPEVIFICTGAPAPFRDAVSLARKGGQIFILGVCVEPVEMDFMSVVLGDLCLEGSLAGRAEVPAAIDFIGQGRVEVEALSSQEIALDDVVAQGFRPFSVPEPGAIKILVRLGGET